METYLKIYTYNGESGNKPFPNEEKQIEIYDFTYDAKRMGGAPTISATVMYDTCLDNDWNDNVFVEFNGEKYFLKNTPTSSKSNTDARYKHELNFISERVILDNVYFYDVVSADFDDHKPVTNSSKFSFHGDVKQLASRLNESLKASGLEYEIIVDEEINSEEKLLSFDNSFFSNALQEIYNVFELPYYFVGKKIHVGYYSSQIGDVLKYGSDRALLSITKQNTNNKIINRITGVGSSENIPYYYPNDTEKGDITAVASQNNELLKTENIDVYNKELYAKKIGLTVDDRDIVKSSLLTYVEAEVRILDARITSSTHQGWLEPNIEYDLPFGESHTPIYVYAEIKFEVLSKGVVSLKPNLYTYGLIRDLSTEVECYFYRTEDETPIYAKYNGGFFELGLLDGGTWYAMFKYNFYFIGNPYLPTFLDKKVDVGCFGAWECNGERYDLKDVGIRINSKVKYGDSFYQFRTSEYIERQTCLMPSIYRDNLGRERFYNALNETYKKENGEYYKFDNPFVAGKPKEHIENFEDIKPTIKEATYDGKRIDMFADVAFDLNDSDETIESTDGGSLNYKHPYFFVKLRKMGFNLFDHAIESGEMTIAVTSGSCGACEFVIGVNDDQKNTVQVDDNGRLVRDEDGNVKFGSPQEKQNDTTNNEVWIALRKEDSSFGQIMPNSASNLKPVAGDTFVILNILLPKVYILQAEKRLENALIDYMSKNNDELFTFDVNFSRIYFEENKDVLSSLNENSSVVVEYNNVDYPLYVSSYSYKMSSSQPLPEIKITLSDKLTQTQSPLLNTVSQIAKDVVSDSITSINVLKVGLPYFVRKDIDDIVNGRLRFEKGINIGKYTSGVLGSGATFEKRSDGNTYLEVDYATIRKKATFTEISIQELKHVGGEVVLSPAAIVCTRVEEKQEGYYCYFENKDSDGRSISQEFRIDDQARCQVFNVDNGNRYYWRLVTEVGPNYIVLSKTDCDNNSDIPSSGDNIVQLGNRSVVTRQNAQILSAYGDYAPSFKQYAGINSYSLEGKEVTVLSPNGNRITGQMTIQSGSIGAENLSDLPDEILKSAQVGADNILLNSGFVGSYDDVVVDDITFHGNDDVYSPNLQYWDGEITVNDEPLAKSGKSITIGNIEQNIDLILGENYVLSFFAKGDELKINIDSFEETKHISGDYEKIIISFTATINKTTLSIIGKNATIYDLKLERGTIPTDWSPSFKDNDRVASNFKDLQYMNQALKDGNTEIIGGLILSSLLQVGKYKDNNLESVTAGINGGWYDDTSVSFWAGGTLKQAIRTVSKFINGEKPTDAEWNDMANFVATHGGDVYMRGYLNALGVSLRGKLETSAIGKRLIIDPIGEKIAAFDNNEKEVLSIDWDSEDEQEISLSPKYGFSMSKKSRDGNRYISAAMTTSSLRLTSEKGATLSLETEEYNEIASSSDLTIVTQRGGVLNPLRVVVKGNSVSVEGGNSNNKVEITNNEVCLYNQNHDKKLFSISQGYADGMNEEIAVIKAYMQVSKEVVKPVKLYCDSSTNYVKWMDV